MTLEIKIDELMPKLHPRRKHLLLSESLGQMSGREVARRILREQRRTDIQVCLSQNQQSSYNSFLNLIGLSDEVADSSSVLAVTIAAHEVGHALQFRVHEKLGRNSERLNVFSIMSTFGEALLLRPKGVALSFITRNHAQEQWFELSFNAKNHAQEQYYIQSDEVRQPKQNLGLGNFLSWSYLMQLLAAFLMWVVVLLLSPILLVVGGAMAVSLVGCALMSRLLVFLTKIHACWIALHFLKKYKVLDKQQRKAARNFLLARSFAHVPLL